MTSPQDPTQSTGGGSPPPGRPEPENVQPKRWLPSLVWIVPLIATLIGIVLVVKSVTSRGPTITISFVTAEGLEPRKTQVKYKDVDIGTVRAIQLASDLSHVLVTVELSKDAEAFAVKGSQFWVVRPRVGASGVSGLSTLFSGAYIGADAGRSHETAHDFVGLENPPAVTIAEAGHRYTLHSDTLGSLVVGTPVIYRRIQVGQVTGYTLDKGGAGVTVQVFINAPYDQYVGTNTRWWHASGINLQLDSDGFKVSTQSLATIVVGGVAFEAPPGQSPGPQPPGNTIFTLASGEVEAMRQPDGAPLHAVMYFDHSLRGLSVGAPVDFRGIVIGRVTDIGVEYDRKEHDFMMPVAVDIYPLLLARRSRGETPVPPASQSHEVMSKLVARGLRGQLRTGNLITGQLFVALDIFPNASPAQGDLDREPMVLPTMPNTINELQMQVADIAKKLDTIPFDQLGNKLNDSLTRANQLFGRVDNELLPSLRGTLDNAQKSFASAQSTLQQDSPMQSDVRQALQELTRTLQSLNALSDYLEQHPESLLRGKSGDSP
jgi:paraquat-inducible protein B